MSTGHLVADRDLALLRNGDAHQLVHAWGEVNLFTMELAHFNNGATLAVWQTQRGVLHFARLLTEDRAEESLFSGDLGLTLRRDLADKDVARAHIGADVDDAALVEAREELLRNVGDVARDLFRPELGVACLDLVLLNVNGGEDVLAHETLADDDRVFVVRAFPRHVGDDDVLAKGELAPFGRHGVGDDLARLHAVANLNGWAVVQAGPLVRSHELQQWVVIDVLLVCSAVWLNHDQVGGNGCDNTWAARDDHLAGVARGATLNTGAHDWRVWLKEWNCLTHHVGTHQGAVCVVMLKERNQRGGHRDHLLWRYVHEVNARWLNKFEAIALTAVDALAHKVRVAIKLGVCLGNCVALLFVGGEVDHVGRDAALLDAAVWRLDEAELVDAAEGRERTDQSDVWSFWRFNWADAAVVAVVDVANVEAGALSRESAWPEG